MGLYKIKSLFIGFVAFVMLFSCTVEKRTYRKGYYISYASKKNKITSSNQTVKAKAPKEVLSIEKIVPTESVVEPTQDSELASANENNYTKPAKKPFLKLKDECGDVITFKTGDEIKAKVVEINDKEIKYKRCDNLDGPLIIAYKYEVLMIKYTNGSKDVFNEEKPQEQKQNKPQTPQQGPHPSARVHPLAISSLLCALFGWAVGLGPIMAIIFGVNALRDINAFPATYSGRGLAIAGIVIGGLIIFLILFIILLAIALI